MKPLYWTPLFSTLTGFALKKRKFGVQLRLISNIPQPCSLERCNSKPFQSLQRRSTLFRRQLWSLQHSTFSFDQLLVSKSDPVNNTWSKQFLFCILEHISVVITSTNRKELKLMALRYSAICSEIVLHLSCI